MEDAFQRLDKLTPEEALMAAAETMTVTRDIDDTVKDVDKSLKGVDGRLGSVIQGWFLSPSLAPESVLTLYSVRCKGDWSSDPTGF